MKKIVSIISLILLAGIIVVGGIFLFKSSNIESVEIVGDVQTIYFVGSTNEVNFNDAELKITYKNGNVKLKKIEKKLVSVSNFSTSIANKGTMKITYKSQTLDVDYAVVNTGLYYLSNKVVKSYNGSRIETSNSDTMTAGVNSYNVDKTTSTEMIYFDTDGSCDYYVRSSSTSEWYMDDGYFNKAFYYQIVGDKINAHLGDDTIYSLVATFTTDGDLTLTTVEKNYYNSTEFLKSTVDRTFVHYEMKGNRTINENNITVTPDSISFKKGSTYSSSGVKIYVKVNFVNDNFLKTVYVRFNESMLLSEKEIITSSLTTVSLTARCFYNGVRFDFDYSVVA